MRRNQHASRIHALRKVFANSRDIFKLHCSIFPFGFSSPIYLIRLRDNNPLSNDVIDD